MTTHLLYKPVTFSPREQKEERMLLVPMTRALLIGICIKLQPTYVLPASWTLVGTFLIYFYFRYCKLLSILSTTSSYLPTFLPLLQPILTCTCIGYFSFLFPAFVPALTTTCNGQQHLPLLALPWRAHTIAEIVPYRTVFWTIMATTTLYFRLHIHGKRPFLVFLFQLHCAEQYSYFCLFSTAHCEHTNGPVFINFRWFFST